MKPLHVPPGTARYDSPLVWVPQDFQPTWVRYSVMGLRGIGLGFQGELFIGDTNNHRVRRVAAE